MEQAPSSWAESARRPTAALLSMLVLVLVVLAPLVHPLALDRASSSMNASFLVQFFLAASMACKYYILQVINFFFLACMCMQLN